MRAEVVGLPGFEVTLEEREDGTFGPPAKLTLSLRTCWKKPPIRLKLVYLYQVQNVAYYHVIEQTA